MHFHYMTPETSGNKGSAPFVAVGNRMKIIIYLLVVFI